MSAGGAGYSYITGGGGMILNRAGVSRLLAPPPDSAPCVCPAPETPDDMQLGRCARRLELPVLHSGRMFQVSNVTDIWFLENDSVPNIQQIERFLDL